MAETITKLPVKNEQTPASVGNPWRPFLGLRQEIERLFDEFDRGLWTSPARRSLFEPFWRQEIGNMTAPAVDVAETEKAYEITAELPGLDQKDVDVKFADGILTIKGEKQEEKEEKKKDYYLSERSYGSFHARFNCLTVSTPTGSSQFQERGAGGDLAEERRGAENGQEDHRQGCVRTLLQFINPDCVSRRNPD
jgi:HSP20 family protein